MKVGNENENENSSKGWKNINVVIEKLKHSTTQWWFDHIERMLESVYDWSYVEKEEWRVCEVYVSETEGPRRGRPLVRWKDKVKELLIDRERFN